MWIIIKKAISPFILTFTSQLFIELLLQANFRMMGSLQSSVIEADNKHTVYMLGGEKHYGENKAFYFQKGRRKY